MFVGILWQIYVESIEWMLGLSKLPCLPRIAKRIAFADFVIGVGDAHVRLKLDAADLNQKQIPRTNLMLLRLKIGRCV